MIQLQKSFFRIVFSLLLFGGFFSQSFASIFSRNEAHYSKNVEFRSPTKKSNNPSILFFDNDEELEETEESSEDKWGVENDAFQLFSPNFEDFSSALFLFFPFYSEQSTFGPVRENNHSARPLYDRFHQWKFDLGFDF